MYRYVQIPTFAVETKQTSIIQKFKLDMVLSGIFIPGATSAVSPGISRGSAKCGSFSWPIPTRQFKHQYLHYQYINRKQNDCKFPMSRYGTLNATRRTFGNSPLISNVGRHTFWRIIFLKIGCKSIKTFHRRPDARTKRANTHAAGLPFGNCAVLAKLPYVSRPECKIES